MFIKLAIKREIQNLIENFEQLPNLIQGVWVLVLLLVIAIIVLIISLKILRTQLRNIEANNLKFRKQSNYLLLEYLFLEGDSKAIALKKKEIVDELKNFVKDKSKRKILVEELTSLIGEISGEIAETIHKLYRLIGLNEYAYSNLNDKRWNVVAAAIHELALFQFEDAEDEIRKFLHHPKKEIRFEAQMFFTSLFQFEGLAFLNELKAPLTEWEQVQMLEVLERIKDLDLQDIAPWLKSENASVVLFALKLIKKYYLTNYNNDIIELLHHSNEEIRIQAITVLGLLQVFDLKELVGSDLDQRSLNEKISYFKVLELIGTSDDEPLILENINNSNYDIRLSAIKILKEHDENKLEEVLDNCEDLKTREMIEFYLRN